MKAGLRSAGSPFYLSAVPFACRETARQSFRETLSSAESVPFAARPVITQATECPAGRACVAALEKIYRTRAELRLCVIRAQFDSKKAEVVALDMTQVCRSLHGLLRSSYSFTRSPKRKEPLFLRSGGAFVKFFTRTRRRPSSELSRLHLKRQ